MARKQAQERVFDRKALDLPINSMVAVAVVKDQFGDHVEVLRSVRDDPLAGMLSRRQIDQAQYEAGRKWQKLHEASTIGGISAIDPTKEAVDGGRIPEPITDYQIRALRGLSDARDRLGQDGYSLLQDILGGRVSIKTAAENRGAVSKADFEFIGRLFRRQLESLAVFWGFAQSKVDTRGKSPTMATIT